MGDTRSLDILIPQPLNYHTCSDFRDCRGAFQIPEAVQNIVFIEDIQQQEGTVAGTSVS